MPNKKWQRVDGWVGSDIEDSFVILNIEGGDYVSFNQSAKDIWEALAQPVSQLQIVDLLTARYDVDRETCLRSVQSVLGELTRQNLVQSAD